MDAKKTPLRSSLPPQRRLVDAVDDMRPGDLLLWRRRGVISIYGRGVHSHAAKYGTDQDQAPLAFEVREFYGGRIVPLYDQVRRCPGRIEVWTVNQEAAPRYDRARAMQAMYYLTGCPYDYRGILRAAGRRWPGVRFFIPAPVDDCPLLGDVFSLIKRINAGMRVYCSAAVALADQVAGCDPVPSLSPWDTEPADLARSLLYSPLCSLIP